MSYIIEYDGKCKTFRDNLKAADWVEKQEKKKEREEAMNNLYNLILSKNKKEKAKGIIGLVLSIIFAIPIVLICLNFVSCIENIFQ